jgi:hypothetical protein
MSLSILTKVSADKEEKIGLIDLKKLIFNKQFKNLIKILHYKIVSRHCLKLILQQICEHKLL